MATKAQIKFVQDLKAAAAIHPHKALATALGVEVWQVWNWLYQNHPNDYRLEKEKLAVKLLPYVPKKHIKNEKPKTR